MKLWLTLYRIATVAFIALVVIAIISAFLPKIRQNQERQRKIAELQEENRRKEESVKGLRRQQEQLATDPKYVEKLAREELGKAKAGEIVYRFGKSKTNNYLQKKN